jgi:hypothetical protein
VAKRDYFRLEVEIEKSRGELHRILERLHAQSARETARVKKAKALETIQQKHAAHH